MTKLRGMHSLIHLSKVKNPFYNIINSILRNRKMDFTKS